jgi:hypothetical protein
VVRTWGFVIHDHAGQAVAAGARMEECLINVQHSETLAYSEGIEYAAIWAFNVSLFFLEYARSASLY